MAEAFTACLITTPLPFSVASFFKTSPSTGVYFKRTSYKIWYWSASVTSPRLTVKDWPSSLTVTVCWSVTSTVSFNCHEPSVSEKVPLYTRIVPFTYSAFVNCKWSSTVTSLIFCLFWLTEIAYLINVGSFWTSLILANNLGSEFPTPLKFTFPTTVVLLLTVTWTGTSPASGCFL